MRVTINPSVAVGSVQAPPSKSVSHRALICGALSSKSTIHNIAYSQDIEATLRCLKEMGATVRKKADSVTIGGLNPFLFHEGEGPVLHCGESGSTLRFLLPICLLADIPVVFVGSPRLIQRPLGVYRDICRQYGLTWMHNEHAIIVRGPLYANRFSFSGAFSSQFVSGLMMAMPLLIEESHIEVVPPFESRSYVALTSAVQKAFGVTTTLEGMHVNICPGGEYQSTEYWVEGDYSNAAAIDAFNLLGGDVKVLGLSPESVQGDRAYKDFYQQLQEGNKEFDLTDCPDLGPVLFALAAVCGGAKFSGTRRLRLKESDRVAAMITELEKFGISATCDVNSVEIHEGRLQAPTQVLCGHNDHRIVMALSLLCSRVGGTIDGADAVKKSYPDYFDVLRTLSIDIQMDE